MNSACNLCCVYPIIITLNDHTNHLSAQALWRVQEEMAATWNLWGVIGKY